MFDPEKYLTNEFGDKNKVIVCDSNKLNDGWRDKIAKSNRNSEYNWHNLTQDMLNLEEYNHGDITEHVADLDDDLDFEELANKDLPKRVLAFSSKLLLEQLSKKLKTSVDGTFKSSCALWGQMFVWMVKADGYWIPTVFGWLPDKSEDSYKVFFHLVIEKMKELRLDLEVESVLCDFELNIMKSIDVMLQCPILGCFFHHKKCFQRRVERSGFKTIYQNDEKFKSFINQCSSLSQLPIEDVQEGLDDITERFKFEDERTDAFKDDFIRYIQDFWIDGCLPPRVWNCFGRSDDLTNNNQEGYNSKFNKELKETHPSLGILLCHINSQILLSEEKIVLE